MKKLMKMTIAVAVLVLAGINAHAADTYASSPATYAAGVYTNGELVVAVTNGMVVGVTADRICLVPYGQDEGFTNTFTLRTPYQTLGEKTIRVSDDATNLVKLATSGSALALGADWIASAGGFIRLDVESTTRAFVKDATVAPAVGFTLETVDLPAGVTNASAATVLTFQRASNLAVTGIVATTEVQGDYTNIVGLTLQYATVLAVTNATAATTLTLQSDAGFTVVTNLSGTVTYP